MQAAQSLEQTDQAIDTLQTQVLFGLGLMLAFAGFGGLLIADRALRPIERIIHAAQSIGASDLSRRIAYPGPVDEVGQIAATFDEMMGRIEATVERERRFLADASHELRTPLAALKGRMGVVLARDRSTADYIATLHETDQEVNRLIRLSTDLLLLARLDQHILEQQPERLDGSDLLLTIVDQMQPLAMAKHQHIELDFPDTVVIYGAMDHLIRLFLNLLDNAIKYSPHGGEISVQARMTPTETEVSIRDTGPGIPTEHLERLFERFFRGSHDRAPVSGGAGLDLSIA